MWVWFGQGEGFRLRDRRWGLGTLSWGNGFDGFSIFRDEWAGFGGGQVWESEGEEEVWRYNDGEVGFRILGLQWMWGCWMCSAEGFWEVGEGSRSGLCLAEDGRVTLGLD